MKEKIEYTEENAFNLLSRLIRVFPFKIEVDESLLNYYRNYHDIDSIAKKLWFAYIFDQMNKKSYDIGLKRYEYYDFNEYINLMEWITDRIITHLNNIEIKPKKKIYTANYNFLLLRALFQALYNYLEILDNELLNQLSKSSRRYRSIYDFLGQFTDDFITENISAPDDLCRVVNNVLKYYGFEDFSLFPDGVLRYQDSTAESEEIKRTYRLLKKKKYSNIIDELDSIHESIANGKYAEGLSNCRIALESFFKRFLINHGMTTLHNGDNTDDSTIGPLAETLKKNIAILFNFPPYSRNLDTKGYVHLLESSKFIISGLANSGGSHGKSTRPKINLEDVKVAESFLIMLINTLLPFEK